MAAAACADFRAGLIGEGTALSDIIIEDERHETRPREPEAAFLQLTVAARLSLIGLFALALMAALYVTRTITVPVLLAIAVGTILAPIVGWAEKRRVPRAISTVLVVLLVFCLLIFFAVALTVPLSDWIGRASELGTLLKSKFQNLREPLAALGDLYNSLQSIGKAGAQAGQTIQVEASPNASVVETGLTVLTPAISQLLIFFVSLIFYLIFKESFKQGAVLAFTTRGTRLRVLRVYNRVEERLTRYFSTFSMINVGLGLVITLAMWVVGMPNPLLWGVLAALLNFFPYLGPAIVTITLIVASLLSFPTLGQAILPPIVYTVIHVIEGEFLTPAVLGYRLSVNPFFLFLSVVFWTWMWGAIGAFLAVPIAMITATVIETVRSSHEQPNLP
jgi:predicted PurR-regulated permease PerM